MHPLELIPGLTFIRPTQRGLHEKGGKYHRYLEDGVHTYVPIYDQIKKVNVTEQSVNIRPSDMITKDNLNAEVDMVIYYQVRKNEESVKKARYNVEDYEKQITSLAQTTARDIIGRKKFETVNSDRSELNKELYEELEAETNNWGIDVVRVEMEEITPPQDVQDSMNEIIKAEKKKEAAEDFATAEETKADGEKRAEIKRAEGKKKATVLEAKGDAEAIEARAKANAKEIELVNNAIEEHFTDTAQTYKELETVVDSLKNGSKYILGTDKPVTTVLNETGDITPIPDDDEEEPDRDLDVDMEDVADKMTDQEQ